MDIPKLRQLIEATESMDPRLWDPNCYVTQVLKESGVEIGVCGCLVARVTDLWPEVVPVKRFRNSSYVGLGIAGNTCYVLCKLFDLTYDQANYIFDFDVKKARLGRTHLEAANDIRSLIGEDV